MNKKGDFGWNEISKILLVIGILVVLIILLTLFKNKASSLIEALKDLVRFGT